PATRIQPSRWRSDVQIGCGSSACRPSPDRRARSPAAAEGEPTTRSAEAAMVSLSAYLGVGALLFAIAVIGIFLNRKNLIVLLMAIELMLLAVNTNFIAFSRYLGDLNGQVFVF